MPHKMFFGSLTRISDLHSRAFQVLKIPRERWDSGDYVVGEVAETPARRAQVELTTGRTTSLVRGDLIVGALGVRHATLEVVGSWEALAEGDRLECLTAAGLLGRVTSKSPLLPRLVQLSYRGHVTRGAEAVSMNDFVPRLEECRWSVPTVLVVGTSMSAGKTTSAKFLVRAGKELGLRVVGAKLSGAGRYRDILAMSDAGADAVFDFVDVGLPSSYGPAEAYRPRLRQLLALMAQAKPELAVIEAGASPLEPYNGETVLAELGDLVGCIMLCASDPYSVVGVVEAFGLRPDVVAGLATSTSAGVELVERLTGLHALNVLAPESGPELTRLVKQALGR